MILGCVKSMRRNIPARAKESQALSFPGTALIHLYQSRQVLGALSMDFVSRVCEGYVGVFTEKQHCKNGPGKEQWHRLRAIPNLGDGGFGTPQ